MLAFASSYTKVHSVHILVETSHQLLVEYSRKCTQYSSISRSSVTILYILLLLIIPLFLN